MKRALVALSLVLCASCGPAVRVGDVCEKQTDCAPGLTCEPGPGGFCSRGCAVEGETRDCPSGTVCTFFGGSTLVCSTYCSVPADCAYRLANYECTALATGGRMSCRPEGVTR